MMSDTIAAPLIEAAGGIVERQSSQGRLIAIVRRERYGPEWVLPKGKRKIEESWQCAALREVKEETGLDVHIVSPGGCTFYDAGTAPKVVCYWRMALDGEPAEFTPNDEAKELRWLAPEDAITILTHLEDVQLLRAIFPRIFIEEANALTVRRLILPWLWCQSRLRSGALRRLSTTIAAYEIDLSARVQRSPRLAEAFPVLRTGLIRAKNAARMARVDEGWKCLLAVQRAELLYLPSQEFQATAVVMRNESTKLNSWRKAAVLELLGHEGSGLTSEILFKAATLRDEHYHNEAYKDSLRRASALMLATFLVAAIAMLLVIDRSIWSSLDKHWRDSPERFLELFCLVGFLGAVVSAITDLAHTPDSARIPEMTATLRVTILRLFIGPASALALFFAANAGMGVQVTGGYFMLVIAFAAGFSERLVLRVIRSIVTSGNDER